MLKNTHEKNTDLNCSEYNIMGNNNLVSEWKKNFKLSQLITSLLFGGILFLIFI